jgi:HK97 gp10 family phage protein
MNSRIVITYNNLPQIAERLFEVVSAIIRKASYDVEAHAKSVVPVDTGKLKNSITVEFPSQTKAIISPHTEYAVFVEFGTRRQRAKPYMRPAAERVTPSFLEAMRRLEEHLK